MSRLMIYRKDKIPDDLQQFFVRAEIGLEESPAEFIDQLVDVFREVRRVLRPDGTLWVNLGDSYAKDGVSGLGLHTDTSTTSRPAPYAAIRKKVPTGLKPKDLAGVPWSFAFAMRDDGWYLRQDIIWAKKNPMPDSVEDRCTRSHEYLFMFAHPDSKGRYYYDKRAILEPFADERNGFGGGSFAKPERLTYGGRGVEQTGSPMTDGRNKRSVWTVSPKPYPGAHFAVWPPALVEPMVRAGTSAHGVCAACGAPWKRVVEHEPTQSTRTSYKRQGSNDNHWDGLQPTGRTGGFVGGKTTDTRWEPTCECVDPGPPVPATVLDPFSGSATTGMVALTEGRNYVGCDINPEFLDLAVARVEGRAAPAKSEAQVADVLDFFNLD